MAIIGGAARGLLKVSRRPPNNPNHTILHESVVWMDVLVEHESGDMPGLDDRPISVEGYSKAISRMTLCTGPRPYYSGGERSPY